MPRTSMKRKRARLQTAQGGFSELFGGPEHLWSRLFGHIQGDGHVTREGGAIRLDAACEAHRDEMALTLSQRECERYFGCSRGICAFQSWTRT